MQFILKALVMLSVAILAPVPVLLGSLAAWLTARAVNRRAIRRILSSGPFPLLMILTFGNQGFTAQIDRRHMARILPPQGGVILPILVGCAVLIGVVAVVPWALWWNQTIVMPLLDIAVRPQINTIVAVVFGLPIVLIVSAWSIMAGRSEAAVNRMIGARASELSGLLGPGISELLREVARLDDLCERVARRPANHGVDAAIRAIIARGFAEPGPDFYPARLAELGALRDQIHQAVASVKKAADLYSAAVELYRSTQSAVEASDSARLRDRLDECFDALQSSALSDLLVALDGERHAMVVQQIIDDMTIIRTEAMARIASEEQNPDGRDRSNAESGAQSGKPANSKMTVQDAYALMRLAPDATAQQIKSTYRRLTKIYHPDGSEGGVNLDFIKELNEAYDLLKRHLRF